MYLKAILGVVIFLLIAAGYAFQIPVFSNTFDSMYLFFRALLFGGVVGFVVGRFLKDRSELPEEKIGIMLGCIFASCIIFPLIAIVSNKNITLGETTNIKVKYMRTEQLITSRFGVVKNMSDNVDAVYTHFIRDGEAMRIRTKKPIFDDVEKGAEVEIPIKKGLWGFYVVDVK
jgi:ABC-type transport system involved in multi-copper enzyme maturation permease subunit